jgi:hypothetical protein
MGQDFFVNEPTAGGTDGNPGKGALPKDKQQRKAERRAQRKLDNSDSDNPLTRDTESLDPAHEPQPELDDPKPIP